MWPMIIAAAVSAAAGAYSSNQAAKAGSKAAEQNAALARQNLGVQLGLVEPARALGYGAQFDLASLYGYNLPAYQTANELMNPAAGSSGPIQVNGRAGGSYGTNPGAPLGLNDPISSALGIGGSRKPIRGGVIDPIAGTVSLTGDTGKNSAARNAILTEYLRTGVRPTGNHPQIERFIQEIDKLYAAGYKFDPNAATAPKFSPVGQPTSGTDASGKTSPPGTTPDAMAAAGGTSPDGTAGNFGRFFTSPDYLFRQQEGARAIDRSAAARSGAIGGNVIKAQTGYASDLAAGEYGNYVNRLLAIANGGTAANTQAGGSLDSAAANLAQSNNQAGDARASGVMGAGNSLMNAINAGLNGYAMSKYLNAAGGAPKPASVLPPNWSGPR